MKRLASGAGSESVCGVRLGYDNAVGLHLVNSESLLAVGTLPLLKLWERAAGA